MCFMFSLVSFFFLCSICRADSHPFVNLGLPVTIRLLDPPLHEFLPEGDLEEIVTELASETGMTEDEVLSRIEKLSEVNPMLGFRGCRYWTRCSLYDKLSLNLVFQTFTAYCLSTNTLIALKRLLP